jgi:hypothetical protein
LAKPKPTGWLLRRASVRCVGVGGARKGKARLGAYYFTSAWYRRVDAVRARARGRCEFCQHRRMQHCHHRTYVRFGQEPLSDLMGVCRLCHQAIHRLGRRTSPLLCAEGSLLAEGDSGMGLSRQWRAYLATCKEGRYAD